MKQKFYQNKVSTSPHLFIKEKGLYEEFLRWKAEQNRKRGRLDWEKKNPKAREYKPSVTDVRKLKTEDKIKKQIFPL